MPISTASVDIHICLASDRVQNSNNNTSLHSSVALVFV